MPKKVKMSPKRHQAKPAARRETENGSILTAEEKKQILKQKAKERKQSKVPRTAQQSIPYQEIYKDGICQVDKKHFNKCITFGDINYQLAQNEDKTAAFGFWCDFYNYFDPNITLQISCMSQYANVKEMEKTIDIPNQGDEFDDIREEYAGVLKTQLAKGNNGLQRKKYITFGIEAANIKDAKPKLERIETDIINNLKAMGVAARSMTGFERLKLLYATFNEEIQEPFVFSYDLIAETGLSTKDFIAPTSFDFRESKYFRMGKTIGAVSFLHILAPELSDKMLADFLDMDNSIIVNLHVQSIDQAKAIKQIKSKITDLDKMKIEEQKKAVRAGYDMDVLPSDLMTYGGEAKKLLEDLQSRNERMFLVTILIMNTATTRKKLDNILFQTAAIAQKYNCALKRLDFRQEQGLMSSLPIGVNEIDIQRGLTTSATAVFVPFTTEELFQADEALYCGINAISNNMIMADRKLLKNPNGLILGTPGSGKSFSAKREMANAFLITKDDIIICDPEGEYSPLVNMLHGQVIKISPASHQYVNPMDINLNYSEDESPVSFKADFILSLCELIVGSKTGLEPVEKTIIDRCVRLTYMKYLQNPIPENMPVMEDLYNCILAQDEPEAKRIATALEIYVTGSLNVFNHRTNVDINNRMVCFDIKELGKQLKKIGIKGYEDLTAGIVKWPMSVVRLQGKNIDRIVEAADHILGAWRGYTDENAFIFSETDGTPHNTITPIARMHEDLYELDLVLRNNITTDECPWGVYHPTADLHHIKKENIGLIEVMGLAVLPARLKKEMAILEEYILEGKDIRSNEDIEKHADWVEEWMGNYSFNKDNIHDIIQDEISKVFVKVLECAGVYKRTDDGMEAFMRFVNSL